MTINKKHTKEEPIFLLPVTEEDNEDLSWMMRDVPAAKKHKRIKKRTRKKS